MNIETSEKLVLSFQLLMCGSSIFMLGVGLGYFFFVNPPGNVVLVVFLLLFGILLTVMTFYFLSHTWGWIDWYMNYQYLSEQKAKERQEETATDSENESRTK